MWIHDRLVAYNATTVFVFRAHLDSAAGTVGVAPADLLGNAELLPCDTPRIRILGIASGHSYQPRKQKTYPSTAQLPKSTIYYLLPKP